MIENKTNRLANEKSPYLLQHRFNPVDWYPWSNEAFKKAADEDKPVFLSIGYSTCHWCHVMEHESFEDEVVAKLLNENFVSIKVDREERPDIDSIYMAVCQMIAGNGGWPLTVVLKPDKKPFFAGTYFPKESRYGKTGLIDLLTKITTLWRDRRAEIESSADQITAALNETPTRGEISDLSSEDFDTAYSQFKERFDSVNGGFGASPKFPSPHNLIFLLHYFVNSGEPRSLEMAEKTLVSMRLGGIYDHLGDGFHRYSTDEEWRLPHFEKMLYDQAMLILAYAEAFKITGDKFYAETIDGIFKYLKRDLCSPQGGYYSAEDADSEGEEGKFYVWTLPELKELFDDEFDAFSEMFHVDEQGNFIDRVRGGYTGENVIYLQEPLDKMVSDAGDASEEIRSKFVEYRTKLLVERSKRIRPGLDDKILADWNGLLIAALASAGRISKNNEYTSEAMKIQHFIESKMVLNGVLHHRYREDDLAIPAFLDDFAFYLFGLIELYRSTFDAKYLVKARETALYLIKHFLDRKNGGFFQTSELGEQLPAKWKDVYDGAIPSGNSVALKSLVALYHYFGDNSFLQHAENLVASFSNNIKRAPFAHAFFLDALEPMIYPSYELVITGERDHPEISSALVELGKPAYENVFVILKDKKNEKILSELAPFTFDMKTGEGECFFYLCSNSVCELPVPTARELFFKMEK
ncbi:thioredoxin domain-containing protein [Ignavibacteriales bacterium]